MSEPMSASEGLRELRDKGLMVAVHNDYRLNGERHTFWLFTTPDGRAIKGEGRTDEEALSQVRAALARPSPPAREHRPDCEADAGDMAGECTCDWLDAKDRESSPPAGDEKSYWQAWAKKRLEIQTKHWMRAARAALTGDMRELRNRVELTEAEPVAVVLSDAPPAVEEGGDDLAKRLLDASNDPYFKLTGGVEDWLKHNWALREAAAARIDSLEAEKKELREALDGLTASVASYEWADDDHTVYMSLGRLRTARALIDRKG